MSLSPSIFPRGGGIRLPRIDGDRRYKPSAPVAAPSRDFLILGFLKGGDARTILNYSEGEGDRSVDEGISLPEGTRVAAVRYNLRGDGALTHDAVIDGANIARRGLHLDGRQARHLFFAKSYCADPLLRTASIDDVLDAAEEWVETFAPGSKYVLIAHVNKGHIHVHLILENYDPETGRRLNFSRYECEKMQELDWYSGDRFQPGKELARVRVDAIDRLGEEMATGTTPIELIEAGRLIDRGNGHFDFNGVAFRPETLRQAGRGDVAEALNIELPPAPRMTNRRESAIDALRALRDDGMPLTELERSGRYIPKLTTKAGGALRRPGFEFDGVAFRADTLAKSGHEDILKWLGMPTARRPAKDVESTVTPKKKAPASVAPVAPGALVHLGAVTRRMSSLASNAKLVVEAITDPATAGLHVVDKVVEHVAVKVASSVVGHPAATLLAGGVRAASGAGDNAVAEVAESVTTSGAKLAVSALVPGGSVAMTALDAVQAIASLVTPPAPPAEPASPTDPLEAETGNEDPESVAAPVKKKPNYGALASLGHAAKNLPPQQQPPEPVAPRPHHHEPNL